MPLGTPPHTFHYKCELEISLLNIPAVSPLELTTMCSLAGPPECWIKGKNRCAVGCGNY